MRILVVEDHADTSSLLCLVLTRAGFTVQHAATVAEAQRIGQECLFDLLLCDITLPDGDGWSLYKDLAALCNVKGIAISGHAYPADCQRSLEAGFSAHLSKPVSVNELLRTIRAVNPASRN